MRFWLKYQLNSKLIDKNWVKLDKKKISLIEIFEKKLTKLHNEKGY